jgi:hypothetical protein
MTKGTNRNDKEKREKYIARRQPQLEKSLTTTTLLASLLLL